MAVDIFQQTSNRVIENQKILYDMKQRYQNLDDKVDDYKRQFQEALGIGK
jgi:hypothetical protein